MLSSIIICKRKVFRYTQTQNKLIISTLMGNVHSNVSMTFYFIFMSCYIGTISLWERERRDTYSSPAMFWRTEYPGDQEHTFAGPHKYPHVQQSATIMSCDGEDREMSAENGYGNRDILDNAEITKECLYDLKWHVTSVAHAKSLLEKLIISAQQLPCKDVIAIGTQASTEISSIVRYLKGNFWSFSWYSARKLCGLVLSLYCPLARKRHVCARWRKGQTIQVRFWRFENDSISNYFHGCRKTGDDPDTVDTAAQALAVMAGQGTYTTTDTYGSITLKTIQRGFAGAGDTLGNQIWPSVSS